MPEEKDPSFTIVDKRHGRAGEETEAAAPESPTPPVGDPPPAESDSGTGLPPVDFSTFVISLSTSALYHMGLVPDPETNEKLPANLPIARHTIDTLEMLQEKTRGNLEPEEDRLIEGMLYELRMRFVEASK